MALDDAKDALLGQHLGAVGAGRRFALVRRHLVGALWWRRAGGAQRADDVRHGPDGVLVVDQDLVGAQGEAGRLVEVLDMALYPFGMARSVVAQQGQVARTLLGH